MDSKQISKEKSRIYREKNQEKYKKYMKMYVKINSSQRRNYRLFRKYGITNEDYEVILRNQNNSCAICLSHEDIFNKRLSVDHCHITNKVRGLLCSDCNRGIGLMKDSHENLKRAVNYLNNNKDNKSNDPI